MSVPSQASSSSSGSARYKYGLKDLLDIPGIHVSDQDRRKDLKNVKVAVPGLTLHGVHYKKVSPHVRLQLVKLRMLKATLDKSKKDYNKEHVRRNSTLERIQEVAPPQGLLTGDLQYDVPAVNATIRWMQQEIERFNDARNNVLGISDAVMRNDAEAAAAPFLPLLPAAEPAEKCNICLEDKPRSQHVPCRNDNNNDGGQAHLICKECFVDYASNSLNRQGRLPCCMYSSGICSVDAIEDWLIVCAIAHDRAAFQRFMEAKNRVAVDQYLQEDASRRAIEGTNMARQETRDLQKVFHAMTVASSVPCPHEGCGARVVKSAACVHITCTCRDADGRAGQFCYLCGSIWGREQCGCIVDSYNLEHMPGWEIFDREGEDAQLGATNEFHRQMCAFFLRKAKEHMGEPAWDRIKQEHPTILSNIFNGRYILWEEIETATFPRYTETGNVGRASIDRRIASLLADFDRIDGR